ncbi:hypothetical protein D9M69_525990 [compost metagenome]
MPLVGVHCFRAGHVELAGILGDFITVHFGLVGIEVPLPQGWRIPATGKGVPTVVGTPCDVVSTPDLLLARAAHAQIAAHDARQKDDGNHPVRRHRQAHTPLVRRWCQGNGGTGMPTDFLAGLQVDAISFHGAFPPRKR